MISAVQFGVLVACVVLFIPMGMAGWHLSRNKMLFFGGVLFITLAVGVHITPYFPVVYDLISSYSSVVILENRDSCLSLLHDIIWRDKHSNLNELWVNSSSSDMYWKWEESNPVNQCGFQKLGRSDASDLLNGSWIMVAGDSHARLFTLSLLNLVLDSSEMKNVRVDLFKRHSDYQLVVEENGLKLDYIWAPYASNLTSMLKNFENKHIYPDVLVLSSGMWHMLHYTNASDYGVSLGMVRKSVVSLVPISPEFGSKGSITGSVRFESPNMFWLGMPTLINSLLNTEEKKEKMSGSMCEAYDRELTESKLLHQSSGPLMLLDVKSLSQNCGSHCTADGMHYQGVVYEAAVQIMLNTLIIESQQQI
ncbi:protein ALTERED XYLOGLUCAN 9-like [Aristolochia californica]|uniref:protein ALTERED XYLOGLUCAN 9-like n=1 Tax=Aristolochia californica TaxID=171875 RepID=UPI0035D6C2BA